MRHRLAAALVPLALLGCAGPEAETWVCTGNSDLLVTPFEDTVQIIARDGTLTLSKVETESGVLYSGAGVEWIPRGTQALLTRDGKTVNCSKLRTRQ